MRIKWTPVNLKKAQDVLKQHTSLPEALTKISWKICQHVSRKALDNAFQAHGLASPSSFLKVADFHPVQKAEVKEEVSRDKATISRLVEELRQSNARHEFLNHATARLSQPVILAKDKTPGVREMTAVVLASDWHVEEPVDPESVAGRNEYNLDIADKRVKKFFEGIIWNIEHHRASKRINIHNLILWLGGDLMTGYIHPELVESNLLSPTETVRWLMPRIRDGILSLQKYLGLEIDVVCSFGNHGRTTEKPRISTGYSNSYEWLMYHCLADLFKDNKDVRFNITNSGHQYAEVYGRVIHFHHGDDVRYQGGVGGIGIPLLKAVPQWDLVRKADVHCIGHWHQLLDYGRAVVNGSLIGYGPYSQRIRASFEGPAQMLFYMDKKRGKCMTTALWVDGVD